MIAIEQLGDPAMNDRRSAVVNRGFLPGLRLMSEQTDRSVIGLEVCALTVLLYRSTLVLDGVCRRDCLASGDVECRRTRR